MHLTGFIVSVSSSHTKTAE